MMRVLLILIALFAAAGLARAQTPKPATAPPAGSAITADQARTALDVLNDPKKRAAFTATLDAIVKGQPQPAIATPAPEPAPPPTRQTSIEGLSIPLAPDSVGAQVLITASEFVNRAGQQIMDGLQTVQSVPLLYGWAFVMVTNPIARDMMTQASLPLFIALVCAVAVEYALRYAMRGPIARVEALAPKPASPIEEPDSEHHDPEARAEAGDIEPPQRRRPSSITLLRRVPLVCLRLLLELVPVIGFAIVGHLIAGSPLGGRTTSRLLILAVVDAIAVTGVLLGIARMLLSPGASRLRLVHLRNATAAYITTWLRRLIIIAVFGYAMGEVGLLFGLSDVAHDGWQKVVGLLLHVCLAIIVIQRRRSVRHWLRAPEGATGLWARTRDGFARIWQWMALFVLAAGWLVWAIEVPHGFASVLHYVMVTALVLIGGRMLLLLLLGLTDRLVRVQPDAAPDYPGIDARLRVYHPAITLVVHSGTIVVALLALLQFYGLGTYTWLFSSVTGQRLLSSLVTLAVTIGLALVVWEAVNLAIQRHLARLQREAQLTKSARLRTLLPLLRTTLLITISIVAGLMVLSEIGVNIAPLLAGAGIVGVAIGFGSQKLVQDLITGIFLLLENAMQVGDFVTVSGLSGSVEALSVRTIRLRAGDGSVHIIPFSAVTSVTNVNRGIGNASISVIVEFEEDTDKVASLLKQIIGEMRAEPDFSARMLGDLQLWGVDKVDGAGVTIAGQVVCTDSGRWPVQREFNRRMKKRFQEDGIRIFNPLRTYTITGSAGGTITGSGGSTPTGSAVAEPEGPPHEQQARAAD